MKRNLHLQTLISGPALLERFQELYGNKYRITNLNELSILAKDQNEDAKKVFVEAGDILATFCVNIIEMLDVTCIIFGGGVLQQGGDLILERVRNHLNHLYWKSKRNILIKKSELGDINGVIGGLALVCETGLIPNDIKNMKPIYL